MKSVFLIRPPSDAEEKLFTRFDDTSRKVRQGLNTAKGGAGLEQAYSIAYQGLVKQGLAQQLKKKYR
jgi:hypothetical protein